MPFHKAISLFILCCVIALAAVTPGPARAESYDLPEGSIEFVAPDGFCPLQPEKYESDKIFSTRMHALLDSKSTVIVIVADCNMLTEFREGYRPFLTRYGILAAIKMSGQVVKIPGATRTSFVDMMAKDFEDLDWTKMRKAVSDVYFGYGTPFRAGEIRPLGIIDKDDNALYAGFIANYGTSDRLSYWGASVLATTLINEYPVSFNLYDQYQGDATFEWLSQTQKMFIPWLIGLNEKKPFFAVQDLFYGGLAILIGLLLIIMKKRNSTKA